MSGHSSIHIEPNNHDSIGNIPMTLFHIQDLVQSQSSDDVLSNDNDSNNHKNTTQPITRAMRNCTLLRSQDEGDDIEQPSPPFRYIISTVLEKNNDNNHDHDEDNHDEENHEYNDDDYVDCEHYTEINSNTTTSASGKKPSMSRQERWTRLTTLVALTMLILFMFWIVVALSALGMRYALDVSHRGNSTNTATTMRMPCQVKCQNNALLVSCDDNRHTNTAHSRMPLYQTMAQTLNVSLHNCGSANLAVWHLAQEQEELRQYNSDFDMDHHAKTTMTLVNRFALYTLYFATKVPLPLFKSSPSLHAGVDRRSNTKKHYDPCLWDNVVCDANFNVIVLKLSMKNYDARNNSGNKNDGNNTGGALPTEIGLLHSLRDLDLQSLHLQSTIPMQLTQLSKLTSIQLSHNRLVGSVPPSLLWGGDKGSLARLSHLDLHDNLLTSMASSSSATNMDMSGLKYINVAFNRLQGSVLIRPHSELLVLNVSHNIMLEHISIQNSDDLKYLDVSGCASGMRRRTPTIYAPRSTQVEYLWWSGAEASSTSCTSTIINTTPDTTTSRSVDVKWFEQLGRSLVFLDLSRSCLTSIPWFSSTSLQKLDLSHNSIHGSLLSSMIASVASSFPNLQILDLSYNSFSGTIPYNFQQEVVKQEQAWSWTFDGDNNENGSDDDTGLLSSMNIDGISASSYGRMIIDLRGNTNLTGKIPKALCGIIYSDFLQCENEIDAIDNAVADD